MLYEVITIDIRWQLQRIAPIVLLQPVVAVEGMQSSVLAESLEAVVFGRDVAEGMIVRDAADDETQHVLRDDERLVDDRDVVAAFRQVAGDDVFVLPMFLVGVAVRQDEPSGDECPRSVGLYSYNFV